MYHPNTEDLLKALITTDPISSTGKVTFFYNARHTIGCNFNMRYFPFDTQNCTFWFGSWTQDSTMITYFLTSASVTEEVFKPNDAWTIISFDFEPNLTVFDCCPHPYSIMYAHLVIQRKSLYYIFNLILPTIIINLLSTFSMFASEGNPDNLHDKLQIGITTLLSYCILLLSVSDQIPKGSTSVPLLGECFYPARKVCHLICM